MLTYSYSIIIIIIIIINCIIILLNIKIYRTIILSVVLYGCETWSLTLREERKLRVFEKRTWCSGEYLDLGRTR